jgi:hypothetical protein
MVSPEQLEASGVVPGSSPRPPAGGGGRSKTIVVAPGDESAAGAAASSPAASGLASSVPTRGASPLTGFLVSFSLDKNGMFWPIRYGRIRIGSDPQSDLYLPYPEVSGEHALVNVRDNKGTPRIWCSDANSMNGTLLNGEDIFNERPELANGDVLKIGPVELKLVLFER